MSDLSSPVTGCHLESDPGVSPGTKKKRAKGALSLLLSLGKQRKKAPAGTIGLLVTKQHTAPTVITPSSIEGYEHIQFIVPTNINEEAKLIICFTDRQDV